MSEGSRGVFSLIDAEKNSPLACYCSDHRELRKPSSVRDQDAVFGQDPPSFTLIGAPNDALVNVDHLPAFGQVLQIFRGCDLSH